MALDRGRAARSSLERAVRSEQLEARIATEAYFHLGRLYRDTGESAAAERHYKSAILLDPTAPGAHVRLRGQQR